MLKVSQDVPMYAMVSGERAELRGLNLEGLRRRGFTDAEVGTCFHYICFINKYWLDGKSLCNFNFFTL